MIDTVREIETPEGVSLRLRAAGALPRAQAWMVDLLLRFAIFFVALIPLAAFGKGGNGLAMLVMFALLWSYTVGSEVWMGGQTFGKRALGLRVVDALPGVYGVGLACTLIDPHARRLGDIVAGTMVIHVADLPAGQEIPALTAVPLPLVLASDEQAVLVEFAERAGQLTVQRQEELANLLTPLTGQRDTGAIRQLVAHANWLLGRA
jgi:uncharacterized RDD family membrane protein YckC